MAKTAVLATADGSRDLGRIVVPSGPVCGEDFCDRCGDCLTCFGCPCASWVVYEDRLAEFLEEHDDAQVERTPA